MAAEEARLPCSCSSVALPGKGGVGFGCSLIWSLIQIWRVEEVWFFNLLVRRDLNLRRMHFKKNLKPVCVHHWFFYVKKTGTKSKVGFKDLLYFYKTKQNKKTRNPTTPKSWSSWLTIIFRFVQKSLTVIEMKFPLLLPNDQSALIGMTRDWGRICKQGKILNTALCGFVVYSSSFAALLMATVHSLGLVSQNEQR